VTISFLKRYATSVPTKRWESLDFATYENRSGNGYWTITDQGNGFLRDNLPLIMYLLSNDFNYVDAKDAFGRVEVDPRVPKSTRKRPIVFDENTVISEGEKMVVEYQTYTRSRKLRETAIEHYSKNGKIVCQACTFDFEAVYGELGRGFIEIHHAKPVFAYEGDDVEKVIHEALANVIPLCSNCHRMVHRRRDHVMPVDELAGIILSTRKTSS
jgi:predicted HNH restriction endonuclease